jgi:hypothetical protein
MRRLHLNEIEDQTWFPTFLRDAVTDTLQYAFHAGDLYRPVVPLLQKALQFSGARHVLDLCSGGGGPWLRLQRVLEENNNLEIEVHLSDKYPNFGALQHLHTTAGKKLTFHADSVARAILQNAAQSREGIGVFEVPRRHPLAILLTFLMPIASFVFVPFMRPFRWSRLLWTYLIPVIPFVVLFDGIVSCLRAYSPAELAELANGVLVSGYRWEAGEVRDGISPVPVTYLIGWPDGPSAVNPLRKPITSETGLDMHSSQRKCADSRVSCDREAVSVVFAKGPEC